VESEDAEVLKDTVWNGLHCQHCCQRVQKKYLQVYICTKQDSQHQHGQLTETANFTIKNTVCMTFSKATIWQKSEKM